LDGAVDGVEEVCADGVDFNAVKAATVASAL
jgi:hypothetical protein